MLLTSLLMLAALAVGAGARLLARVPGASTDAPVDQVVLTSVMLTFAAAGIWQALFAIQTLAGIVLTIVSADDPAEPME